MANSNQIAKRARLEVSQAIWRRVAKENGFRIEWGEWVVVRRGRRLIGKIAVFPDSGTGNPYPLCSQGSYEVSRLREQIGDAMKAEHLVTMA